MGSCNRLDNDENDSSAWRGLANWSFPHDSNDHGYQDGWEGMTHNNVDENQSPNTATNEGSHGSRLLGIVWRYRLRSVGACSAILVFILYFVVIPTLYVNRTPPTNNDVPPVVPNSTNEALTMNDLLTILPHSTREALKRPNSPQSKALHWLGGNDGNITLQRFALGTIFYSGSGGVLYTTHESDDTDWPVTCNSKREVTGLDFDLKGHIPIELFLLVELTTLSSHRNKISGTLPTEIGLLNQVTNLVLVNTHLNSTLPTELGRLTHLKSAHLSNAKFMFGTIPTEMGLLNQLTLLHLTHNYLLSGTLPTELGRLTNLEELAIESNQLTGTVSTFLGRLSQLTSLYLHGNQFTRSMPTQLCDLHLHQLYGTCSSAFPCECCTHCCQSTTESCIPNS